ncbi:hypothetical protein HYALB_00004183 [Hymenoscyphus albidus]|uniref:Uncharacterized protein n=1 Tax=Hymenoscyphus albidus TaxID=595503 RepID=A0A9N9LZI4_9HELO|nr:hypothetical protein HYALB_00004183 [Hymenoscyphus albidus]
MLLNVITLALLGSLVGASAIPKNPPRHVFSASYLKSRAAGAQAVDQLLQIAPKSKSCDGASFKDECRTAAEAAPFLIKAMADYQITVPNEIAAVLALIALESGEFQYNTNHFPEPGRPGQGTRNMQMPDFNLAYAKSIPALKEPLAKITTADTTAGMSPDQLNAIRALVLPDEYSWGSAAWFLTTKCASSRPAIQAGGDAGLKAYSACVGVEVDADRTKYYNQAQSAFGLK